MILFVYSGEIPLIFLFLHTIVFEVLHMIYMKQLN